MITQNIAAWTPSEPLPPFISINHTDEPDGVVSITIRGRTEDPSKLGPTVDLRIARNDLERLARTVADHLQSLRRGPEVP